MGFLPAGAELLDPYPDLDAGTGLVGLTATADQVSAGGLKRAARALLAGKSLPQGQSVLVAVAADRRVRVLAQDPGVAWTIEQLYRAPGAYRYASVFRRDGDQWAQAISIKLAAPSSSWRTPVIVGAAAIAVLLVVTRKGARR